MNSILPVSSEKPKVLLVEDERSLADLYAHYLHDEGVDVDHVATGREALEYLDNDVPDAVLLDIRLPDMLGTEVLRAVNDRKLPTAAIMITAHASINTAVETMRGGAYDFLVKPFNRDRLVQTLRAALTKREVKRQVSQNKVNYHDGFQGFVGGSKPMQMVYRMIERAAPSNASIFILGESGTGKEVAARALHELSDRKDKEMVAINCAAIPKTLLESEIFGYVKGAFTGAVTNHDGAATRAHGSTLFLDEICELDLHLQSKLLRFVQTGTFAKVGSSKQEKVDIRFICATNRDPLEEIGAGRFREDLYYRLHVLPISMPPLRERGDDILALANTFLKSYAEQEKKSFTGFDADAAERLLKFSWPGNVRQLQNIIRNLVVLNDGGEVSVTMLPPPLDSERAMTESTHRFAQFNPGLAREMGIMPAPNMTVPGMMAPLPAGYPRQGYGGHGYPGQGQAAGQASGQAPGHLQGQAAGFQGYANGGPNGANGSNGNGQAHAGLMPGLANPGLANPGLANPGLANPGMVNGVPGGGEHAPGTNGLASDDAEANGPKSPREIKPLWETEKEAILEAIESCGGNIPKAANLLGISASTIYRKKQAWEAQEKRKRVQEERAATAASRLATVTPDA